MLWITREDVVDAAGFPRAQRALHRRVGMPAQISVQADEALHVGAVLGPPRGVALAVREARLAVRRVQHHVRPARVGQQRQLQLQVGLLVVAERARRG